MKKKFIINKKYTSIQISLRFRDELMDIKKKNHIDSYEHVIKFLMKRKNMD